MKIALFVHCFFPTHFYGTETYTLQVARQLRSMGHDPVVVSAAFPGEPRRESAVTTYRYDGLRVYCIDKNYIPQRRVKETYYQEALRDTLKGVLEDIRPEIVHVTHLINHTAVLLEVVRDLGVPAVATLTDFFGFCYNNRLEAADGSLCPGPSRTRANCVACHLKAAAQANPRRKARLVTRPPWVSTVALGMTMLARVPGFSKARLGRLVHDLRMRPDILHASYQTYRAVIAPTRFLRDAYVANGLDLRWFDIRFGVDISREPKPRRNPGTPVTFGFIGQLAPHKGPDLLIDAFTRLPRGSSRLQIYGPEDQAPAYTSTLKRAAAGHAIRFLGTFPSEKMAEVLAGLDVVVIPSRWHENSPLVLLGALATHTPVVVSDVAGLTEFVDEGRRGFRFALGSVDDLTCVLSRFVDDSSLAATMSRTTEYTRTTRAMVEDVLSVYAFAKAAACGSF
jgi:glycosyltransferase involved in cell wall biosynthesis